MTASLTPLQVVKAFQEAGFIVDDLKKMTYFPGPMAPGFDALEFYSYSDEGERVGVLLVLYASKRRAKEVVDAVNKLNREMDGGYDYAFFRGPIVMQVGSELSLAKKYNKVFQSYDRLEVSSEVTTNTDPHLQLWHEADVMAQKDPDKAFQLISQLTESYKDKKRLCYIGDAPLEDLLLYHGEEVIGRVEELAMRNENFKYALKCVRDENIQPEIMQRVLKASGRMSSTDSL